MSSQINKDLEDLVMANVITSQIKENISNYYEHKKAAQPNKLFAIFGVLGSLLVGLGIILIIAHNWDDFSRTIKTVWAFFPLVMGQLMTAFTLIKNKSAAWRESAAVFLFFGIGASISLVSQIYNIKGEMSSFLLTWIILAAPLVYLLKSHSVAMFHLLFATIYVCNVGYFNSEIPYLYILQLLWLLPYYVHQIKTKPKDNLTGIFHWLLPISVLISLGAFIDGDHFSAFLAYIFLFGLFYNIGKLSYFNNKKLRVNGYLLLGSLGTVVTLMILSFRLIWSEYRVGYDYGNEIYILVTYILGIAAISVLGYLFYKKQVKFFNLFQYTFIAFAVIYAVRYTGETTPVILTNILVLALGIFAVEMGARKNLFSILNYALLIITVLITCRFFDTDISFVIRGLLFVAIGVGFFRANYCMYKKASRIKISEVKNNNLKNLNNE